MAERSNEEMGMQIRKAKMEDVESMGECMRLASEDSSEGGTDTVNTRQQLTDLVESTLCADTNQNTVLVLIAAKELPETTLVQGFIAFKCINHLSLLFVRPDQQSKGVGRSLWCEGRKIVEERIHHLYHKGNDNKEEHVLQHYQVIPSVITVYSSVKAVSFYEKLGFSVSGELFKKRGRILTPMVLCLQPHPT